MVISYAQNLEDVMLWRALGCVENGYYVDIGAQHPVVDSVSKAFYDHGWRGVHVEPTSHYASLLRELRPDETVIQAAVSSASGMLTLFEIPETGLSTASSEIAEQHRKNGFDIRPISVPGTTLDEVFSFCEKREIHWLKIDVEGFEGKVLEGWSLSGPRPWVVLIESTLPLTKTESHAQWEPLLVERGYTFAYFDGLNRYYVSNAHSDLIAAFGTGPNVFDGFAISGTSSSSFAAVLNRQVSDQADEIERLKREYDKAIRAEMADKEALGAKVVEGEAARIAVSEMLATRERELGALASSANQESLRLSQTLAAREQELGGRLQASQQESLRLSQTLAAREQELSGQLQVSQQESLRLSQTLAAREQELSGQLQASQQESLRLSQARAAREQELSGQLQASQQESLRLSQALAAREQELGGQLQASQQESLRLSKALAAREQELSGELQASQQESLRLSQALAAREQELSGQLQASQQNVSELKNLASTLQRESDARALEISLLHASTSWRLTTPLRWFGRLFRT